MQDHSIQALQKAYSESRLLVFIGAGVTMSLTWVDSTGATRRGPSWTELVNDIVRELDFDPDLLRVRGIDLHILEYCKQVQPELIQRLALRLNREWQAGEDAVRHSPIHKELVALSKCRLFYTTNYDEFLEKSFMSAGRPYRRIADPQHMGFSDEKAEIIKFHGDLLQPNRMVLSESDFRDRLSLSTAMDHRLRADLLGRTCLFIGYSFTDVNVAYLLHSIGHAAERDKADGPPAYIVYPDPSDFEFRLFRSRGVGVIPVKKDTITNDIAGVLQTIRGAK